VRIEAEKQIAALEKKLDESKKKLAEIGDAAEEAWADLARGLDDAWTDISGGIKGIIDSLK